MKEKLIGKRIKSFSMVEGSSAIIRFDFDDDTSLIIVAESVFDSPVNVRFKYRDSRYHELMEKRSKLLQELQKLEKELKEYDDLKL